MAKKKETQLDFYTRLRSEQIEWIRKCEESGKSYTHPTKGDAIRLADQNELKRIEGKLAELQAQVKKPKKAKPEYVVMDGISEIKIILDAGMPNRDDVSKDNPRAEHYPQSVVYLPYYEEKEDYGEPIAECDAHHYLRQGVQFVVAMNHMTEQWSHYESKQTRLAKI